MKLKLHERRTKTRLFSDKINDEDQCYFCLSHNTVNQLEPLKPNIHGLTDGRSNVMLEHRVSCMACGADWVDVFCRIYPESDEQQDEQDGGALLSNSEGLSCQRPSKGHSVLKCI